MQTPFDDAAMDLFQQARMRGEQATQGQLLPPGLDHFTVYAGLIGNALELAKLVQTEQRDMAVIESHYAIATAQIDAAFKEVEAAMLADFERDQSLKDRTFEAITQLIAAGQYAIASEFHKRLIDDFQRSSLDSILDHRNRMAGATGSRLSLR